MAEPDLLVLLAAREGRVVGLHVARRTFHLTAARVGLHAEDLYVRPDARAHGRPIRERVSAALSRALGHVALAYGAHRVTFDARPRLRALFARMHGRPLDDWLVLRLEGDALARLGSS